MIKPYKLRPTLKNYIWGGKKLAKEWNKSSPNGGAIAECWELSCNKDGDSYLCDSDKTLKELLEENPSFVGKKGEAFSDFPILIKLIDSESNLSIQVHPSDEYAMRQENQYGKTEMWYIVSAEKGAGVYCGFKTPLERHQVAEHLKNGTICSALNFLEVKAGDSLLIEAGTVHAICGGLIICEVQQNSSLTYRLYDYDRLDSDGKKRELHIEKSLDVINSKIVVTANSTSEVIASGYKRLCGCQYFVTYEITGDSHQGHVDNQSFHSLTFLDDAVLKVSRETMNVSKGETVFLPANIGNYQLKSKSGSLKVIKATL